MAFLTDDDDWDKKQKEIRRTRRAVSSSQSLDDTLIELNKADSEVSAEAKRTGWQTLFKRLVQADEPKIEKHLDILEIHATDNSNEKIRRLAKASLAVFLENPEPEHIEALRELAERDEAQTIKIENTAKKALRTIEEG